MYKTVLFFSRVRRPTHTYIRTPTVVRYIYSIQTTPDDHKLISANAFKRVFYILYSLSYYYIIITIILCIIIILYYIYLFFLNSHGEPSIKSPRGQYLCYQEQ